MAQRTDERVTGTTTTNVVSLSGQDKLWAVVASVGRTTRVAEIHLTYNAAEADRTWREQQVRAYDGFIRSARQPAPIYSVRQVRRADLPRSWTPLPALGFLRGRFA